MRYKRWVLFLLSCLLMLSLSGCEPAIQGMLLETYPDRIVYVAGVDTALDLTGGSIRYTFRVKQSEEYEVRAMADLEVRHTIDFQTPGVYKVQIYQHEGAWVTFPVQVISSDFIAEQRDAAIQKDCA